MTKKRAPHHPPKKPSLAAKLPEPPQSAQPADKPFAWSYPFPPASKDDPTDPMTYMKALATAEDGFYPLGASGYWHGGIHFGEKTAAALKQGDGVCAIATGEVVAYRLDSTYPELTYNEPKQHERYALYSTGFVLVRHTLTLPPVPQKPGPTPAPSKAVPASAPAGASGANATPRAPATTLAPSSPPPDETLTFFSLYMHTLDWATYQAALKQAKAAGANSRATKLQPFSYWQTERIYRALKPNQQELPKPKSTSHPDDALECDMNSLLPGPIRGARVRAMPDNKSKIYGLLPDGSEVILNESDNGGHAGWAKISEVRSGTPVGPVVGRAPDANVSWGYVFMSDLALVSQSGPLDQVVVLTKPHSVKAGEVIAHIGQYQRYREAKPVKPLPTRPLLHLEVFAGPDLPAFINKSQARAKQLPDLDKPLLEILAGAKLVTKVLPPNHTLEKAGLKLVPVSDPKSRWVKVQPKTVTMPVAQPASAAADKGKSKHAPMKKPGAIETPAGDPFWVDGSLANKMTIGPVQGWKDFPLHMSQADGPGTDFRDVFRVADLDRYDIQSVAREDKDASGKQKRWWNITVGTKDGGTSQGWVREEDHPKVSLCSPWDWPGFELVDNSSVTPTEMFKRQLFVAGLAVGADQERFKTSADTLAASELIQKLERAIDANHDGSVTAAELANAQNVQWSAEAISHMVVKSESEWGGNMAQWEALTPYMKAMSWKWQNEMERIKKLQWWEDIQCADTKILPKEPKPWHLHPIGLIGNFMAGCSDKCKTDVLEFPTSEGSYYASVEGFHLILDTEGYGSIPYVPGGSQDQSSGVTIGYGYDLGQQPDATARNDLSGFFTEAEISRLLTAIGKRGDAARALIPSLSDIKISEPKALEMAKNVKRRYAQFTVDAFPGVVKLHPHCQGALLSLVYNRGSRLEDKPGQKSRVHMRNIKAAIQSNNLPEVAAQLRAMKVLWEGAGADGLLKRRDSEAVLFEKGMNCDCWR
ncbi:lytic transglycosylase domain-containing protein [Burkholderia sp. Se-20378]|uniref:lytic transglycosylase domain-containing protein n=1 Tax=Burkholderia sp. Se-20378 TaxID=2703899 RepID=UPI00198265BB|nr:lytic transglycosylase domain-containing protein [Burkholderia sp. Se-20378]MBN3769234.1 lytic transglycosylase domain-containing protein [Burkholderia sp. Se-20378]